MWLWTISNTFSSYSWDSKTVQPTFEQNFGIKVFQEYMYFGRDIWDLGSAYSSWSDCHTFCLLLNLSLPGLHTEQTTRITPSTWDNWILTLTFQTVVTFTVQHIHEWAWLSAIKWSALSYNCMSHTVNMYSVCGQQKKGHWCYCNCFQYLQTSSQLDLRQLRKRRHSLRISVAWFVALLWTKWETFR